MEFLSEYGLFLAKVVTLVVALLVLIGFIAANREQLKERVPGYISVTKLNDRYEQFKETLLEAVMDKHEFSRRKKQMAKDRKARDKALAKKHKEVLKKQPQEKVRQSGLERTDTPVPEQGAADAEAGEQHVQALVTEKPAGERKRIFVMHFDGDIKASALSNLREEVTAVLQVAEPGDEVLVCLESPGGMVANYGLAASQLSRVRSAGIQLTVAVDKVAASGGYMMACVADRILAAPFAMVGSIGVVAQLPNFHRLLKRHDVDFELFTAGEYKRTVTMFGENTPEGREKFQSDLEEIHALFQHFVAEYRPALDIAKVATGEVWFGQRALDLGLVDELKTSDEYLTHCAQEADLYQVEYKERRNIAKKIGLAAQGGVESMLMRLFSRLAAWRHQAQ
ncbi:protease SohB [Microbulbifer thermotolerans]|uniref:Protease SohB n=1 Tax=Microbulbifer thermotolerans TaxID=252514 RepID=A0A143HM07_MICTH|nr:protease SohB [Microbulbifer thermotolerans]AMX02723.1 protease SohB [Microbulbifer thermotolerans]MCX2779576.1 protease SohB [Microbulbifer thermotolerans]MCX2794554.1 protease SohB [Microbulbifer thermotolerans]MCX2804993.1 protease SohB [Microbulbifer thermotolerans]MCX2831643.1 protease SohB [Microbulbifer thermotolerans]